MDEIKYKIDTLQVLITDEVMKALGLPVKHWSRKSVQNIIRRGTHHFAELCAALDSNISSVGFNEAMQHFIPNFITGCYHWGTSHIPRTGPVLIVANHPGAADALTALALLNRDDVKMVLSGVPFTGALPSAQRHFIHVTADATSRSMIIREIIEHLHNGGAVFMFPTGHVTPDPSTVTNSDKIFEDWSQSVALVMQRCPDVNLLITIISDVILPKFLNSPLCKLRKLQWRQQILAEFMQIIWQMMRQKPPSITPRVTFITPISGHDLVKDGSHDGRHAARMHLHTAILEQAQAGLQQHLTGKDNALYTPYPNILPQRRNS